MIRRSILLLILGIALAGAGVFMGTSSHQVTYQSVGQGTIAHYLSDNTTGYLQMSNSPTLYTVNEKDFSPAINGTSTFQDGDTISFVYEPSSTTDIDSSSSLGTHLQGTAYKVVQITRTDAGAAQQFVSSEYTQNPNGFYQNNWPTAIAMLLGGLVLLGLGFFLLTRRKKPAAGFGVTPSPAVNAMGGQPGANPYQQPYQDVGQYPGQAGQYGYGQPPQGAYPPVQPGSGQYPPAPAQYGQPPQGAYPPPSQYDPNRPYNPPPTP
ncbi:MAG: LPXTG cell wall anchor domain-containing protein [Ktedonobacteraceae bacterium]